MTWRDWWDDPPDIVPLTAAHDIQSFTCGEAAMDDFLRTAPHGASPLGTVWVATPEPRSPEILGYYCVAPDPVELVDDVGSIVHGVVLTLRIERLATAEALHGQGLGAYLMARVFELVLEAAEVHPIETITLVPLTQDLRMWYRRLGFVDDPDSVQMILSVGDLRSAAR